MFDELYPETTETAFKARVERPPEPKPTQRFSTWGLTSAVPKGVAAGAAQGIGSTADVLGAFGSVLGATGGSAGGMFSLPTEEEDKQAREASQKLLESGPDYMSEGGRSFRNVAKDYTPDPLTAHESERMVFEFSRVAAKAVTAGAVMGPVPGAVVAGAEEGFTVSDNLAQEGVDLATRTKVGAVTAVTNAVSFALPVAGKTVGQTVGLALAGGPVSFIAQNAASRKILQDADYTKLADQYDPFDPLGLALSTILPLGFGAMAMRGARQKGSAALEGKGQPAINPIADETIDAARTALLRENIDAANPLPNDLTMAQPHADAHARAIDQMAAGERVAVTDVLPEPAAAKASADMAARIEPVRAAGDVARIDPLRLGDEAMARLPDEARAPMQEMYIKAAQEKPAFDATVRSIADEIGGTAKLADLKSAERSVDKVIGDYAGDPTKIKDLVRATIVAETAEAAQRAVENIFKKFDVLPGSQRNLLHPDANPADGYRDAKFNVMINGHVAEVQVNLPDMLKAKKQVHPIYEERSKLDREYAGKVMPAKVQKRVDALNAKMKAVYDTAWADFTSALKASSDTGAPLRRAESGGNTRGGEVSQAMEKGTPGQSGLSDTGTPSTSSSSALGPKAGSDMGTSDAPIVGETAGFYQREVARLAAESPDMPVLLEGMDAPAPLSEVLAKIQNELDDDLSASKLLQTAAECFISGGA